MTITLEPQVEVVSLDAVADEVQQARFSKVNRLRSLHLVWTWEHLGLTAILLLSAFLGLWGLDKNGYSNDFYAAAVKSMLLNWRNFFFASFDPGGFVTVDKPPLALWIQTISAKIFGFNGVSLLLPDAIAGVLGVALLYFMVKHAFGKTAGFIAALVLAVTPIFVVMNRHINPDSLMVFLLLLAAWAWQKAAQSGRLRWLLLGSLLLGLDFNTKTLEAVVVLPALYLLYFLLANTSWRKRIVHLVLATLVVIAISFSWSVAVDLTPASSRPYVGGSTNNTELNLIFGYNGLGRVEATSQSGTNNAPSSGGPTSANNSTTPTGQTASGVGASTAANSTSLPQPPTSANTAGNTNQFGGGGGGTGPTMGGTPGVLRLFGQNLAGEFGWFLPLALLGLLFASVQTRFGLAKGPERRQRLQSLVVWGGWLLLYGAVFSFSTGTSHSYYLTALAPAQAALAGIGIAAMWQSYRKGGWQAWFLPVTLAVTAFFQAYVLSGFSDWNSWLAPVLVVLGLVALVGLGLGLTKRATNEARRWSVGVVGLTLAGLLIVPTALSIRAVFTAITGSIPSAIPGGAQMGGGPNANQTDSNASNAVLDFVKANLIGQLWLLVALVGVVALVIVMARLQRGHSLFTFRRVTSVALIAFLLSSGVWWFQAGQAQASNTTSTAADHVNGGFGFGGGGTEQVDTTLLNYLETNRGGYTYLVAVNSDMSAAPYILATGQAVMSMGGFSGSDQILTVSSVEQLIKNHTVRYFQVGGGGGPGGNSNSQVTQWITAQCKVVNYSSTTTTTSTTSASATSNNFSTRFGGGPGGQQQSLYDCSQAVA